MFELVPSLALLHVVLMSVMLSLYFVQQDQFDMLLVNLRMDSTFVKESMNIKWVSETGIVENMAAVVKDFKETRGLLVST